MAQKVVQRLGIAALILLFWQGCQKPSIPEDLVAAAVRAELDSHPEAQLLDLYKNLFQARYGPGHLIPDATIASRFLDDELASMVGSAMDSVQAIGYEGRYVRVDLGLVKSGAVDREELLEAFVTTANEADPVQIDDWVAEWSALESVIRKVAPDLPGYDDQASEIRDRLARGEYVGHHSTTYERLYRPHYRVIEASRLDDLLTATRP